MKPRSCIHSYFLQTADLCERACPLCDRRSAYFWLPASACIMVNNQGDMTVRPTVLFPGFRHFVPWSVRGDGGGGTVACDWLVGTW